MLALLRKKIIHLHAEIVLSWGEKERQKLKEKSLLAALLSYINHKYRRNTHTHTFYILVPLHAKMLKLSKKIYDNSSVTWKYKLEYTPKKR